MALKMEIDCGFTTSLYSNKIHIAKLLTMCKNINNLDTEYLYSLLCKRFPDNQIGNIRKYLNNWTPLYCLANKLAKLQMILKLNYTLDELYLASSIDLHNKWLTVIPTEMGTLNSLQKLYLSNNQLTVIPNEIGTLNSLQTLYLYNNRLTFIPSEIRSLRNLTIYR